jgi:hypothetical protein
MCVHGVASFGLGSVVEGFLLGTCENFSTPASVTAHIDDTCVVAHCWLVEFGVLYIYDVR